MPPGLGKGEEMINLEATDCPRCGGETATTTVAHADEAKMLTVCLACGGLVQTQHAEPWRLSPAARAGR